MTDSELQDLLEYLGQEQACYTVLTDLSRQQRTVIETGQVDDLLRLLGEKQRVLSQVGEIEKKLLPFKKTWKSLRQTLDESQRGVLNEALKTVEELLGKLIAEEKQSEQLLVQRRDQTRDTLTEAVRGKSIHDAYAQPGTAAKNHYLDLGSK